MTVSKSLQIIGQIFAFDTEGGVDIFDRLVWSKLRTTKFDSQKLQTSLYHVVLIGLYLQTVFFVLSQCTCLSDRRTDRQTDIDSKSSPIVRCAPKCMYSIDRSFLVHSYHCRASINVTRSLANQSRDSRRHAL